MKWFNMTGRPDWLDAMHCSKQHSKKIQTSACTILSID